MPLLFFPGEFGAAEGWPSERAQLGGDPTHVSMLERGWIPKPLCPGSGWDFWGHPELCVSPALCAPVGIILGPTSASEKIMPRSPFGVILM